MKNKLYEYNIIDNNLCPLCKDCIENDYHFMIECRILKEYRDIMKLMIKEILNMNDIDNDYLYDIMNDSIDFNNYKIQNDINIVINNYLYKIWSVRRQLNN